VGQLLAFPDAFLPDVHLYVVWSQVLREGQYPVGDPFWQYPPGAGVIFAALPLFGPAPVLGFVCLALLADATILMMLLRVVDRSTPRSWWGPAAWVVGGLAVGPVMLARFDLFPTAMAVAALVTLGRPVASGALAGLGTLLKVWPILLLLALPRGELRRALPAFVVVVVGGALAITTWAAGSTAFIGEQRDRGLQVESVGAIPYLVAGAIGMDPGIVLRFGAFEIDGVGVGQVGLVLTLIGIVLLVCLAGLRLLGRLESLPGGDVALLAVIIAVATSRAFSPQYAVWLVGIGAAAACDPRSQGRRATTLLIAMASVTQVLFPWGYAPLLDTAPSAVALHIVRIALLGWALASIGRSVLGVAVPRLRSTSASSTPR